MRFHKYPSIANHYQKKFLYHILETLPKDTTFYITEKIHGANFAIYISKDSIKFASRNEFLGDKKFFNYKEVVIKYQECFDIIQTNIEEDEYYVVYGELFGGSVQKECYYKDEQDFVCFDIAIVKEDNVKFLDTSDCIKMCDVLHLPYLPVLFSGTLNECLKYNNTFITTLNLEKGTECEGVIIRPDKDCYVSSGSRIILKSKNSIFAENRGEKHRGDKLKEGLDGIEQISHKLFDYINENRINSFVSKVGDNLEMKLFSTYLKEIYDDCLADFQKEYENDTVSKEVHKIAMLKIVNLLKSFINVRKY